MSKIKIKENLFYKMDNFKTNQAKRNKVLKEVILTRSFFNLHKTKKYYDYKYKEEFNIKDDSVPTFDDVEDIKNTAEDVVMNNEDWNAKKQVLEIFQSQLYNLSHSSSSIIIAEMLLLIATLLGSVPFILFFIGITALSYINYQHTFSLVKRNSMFGPDAQEENIKKMKSVELFSIFTITFIVTYNIYSIARLYFLNSSLGERLLENPSSANVVYFVSFIIIVALIILSAYLLNVVRTYIQYDLSVRERYEYVQAGELWTPETSIISSDLKKTHPILGFVNNNPKKPYYLRYNDLNTHHLVLGGTGSGKSALVFLPLIAQFLEINETGIIVIDPKGDLIEDMRALVVALQNRDKKREKKFNKAKKFLIQSLTEKINNSSGLKKQYYIYKLYKAKKSKFSATIEKDKKIMIFDPKDINCPYFNPLRGSLEEAQKLFKAIILAGSDENSFFDGEADNILTNAVNILKTLEQAQHMNDGISAGTIAEIKNEFHDDFIFSKHVDFYLRNTEKMKKYNAWASEVISAYQAKNLPNMDIMETSLSSMKDYAKEDKVFQNTSGLRSKVAKIINNKHLNYIYNPSEYDQESREELNFAEAIKNRSVIGIATRQDILTDRYARVLGLSLILVLQQTLMSIPKKERQMMQIMIDEFQVFANDDMGILLNQGRSYLACLHLATQTTKQIDLYTNGLKDTVLGNTFYKTIFSSLNQEDTKYFLTEAGAREEEVIEVTGTRVNKNTGVQDNDHILQKKKTRISNIDEDKLQYGQDQYGYSSGRYVLARRRPQYLRFAFLSDWIGKEMEMEVKKLDDEYVELLKDNAKKYLASNLNPVNLQSTKWDEIMAFNNKPDATDIF